MRRSLLSIRLCAAALACGLAACGGGSSGSAPGGGPSFISYPITSGIARPGLGSVAAGARNTIWFAASYSVFGEIGSITTAGAITTVPLPADMLPEALAASSDGTVWFAANGVPPSSIGHLTAAGTFTDVAVPGGGIATAIALGPDGAIWFPIETGYPAGQIRIGRLSPQGEVTVYPVPTPANAAQGITAGPDGALWFTLYTAASAPSTAVSGDAIGRITTAGTVRTFPLPQAGVAPGVIAAGPDGALWFGEQTAPRIGRITTVGAVQEFSPPVSPDPIGGIAQSIAAGNDGAVWFVDSAGIGRITVAGAFTQYQAPANGAFGSIVQGPDGAFWLSGAGAMWRFVP